MNVFIGLIFILFSLSAHAFKVVIDPGHGGADLGAVRDSFVESKIVLAIALKVEAALARDPTITAELTRTKNQSVSLKERVELANKNGADLFVSLHANSNLSTSATGLEFYFNSPNIPKLAKSTSNATPDAHQVIEKIKSDFNYYSKTERSRALSQKILDLTLSGEQKAVIRRAPFYVVENTRMPSVLIELGFITNRRDAKKLISEEYQNKMAEQIARSITEFKEKSDKIPPL